MDNWWWLLAVVAAVAVLAAMSFARRRKREVVYEWEWALLYLDGKFQRILPAGRHRTPLLRESRIVRMPRGPQVFSTGGVDVLTSDRFSARLTVSLLYRMLDPVAAQDRNFSQRFGLMLNETLVRLVSERTLEGLLADRGALGPLVLEVLAPAFAEVELETAMIANLTLPPDIRKLLTETERARLEGQASLERARSEQASLRSLANAARMLKDNPELMRLRTLQAVSPTGKGATLVLGSDAILSSSQG